MTGIRVLVTGSREFGNRPVMASALSRVAREHRGQMLTIVNGGARGADRLAAAIARDYPNRMIEEPHIVTDWRRPDGTKDGGAGYRRNQRMVDAGAEVCLAFLSVNSENKGTRGCIAAARRAGIEVREHWDRQPQPADSPSS